MSEKLSDINWITYFKGNLNDFWKYSNGKWTWISGNSTINAAGVYGTQGVPSTSNYPGGRDSMGFGIDSSGSSWIFGGSGYGSNGNSGEWKIININWIIFKRWFEWSLEIF